APDDGVAGDGFGFSVSVSGDQILIGAPYATVDGNGGEGTAYVFTRADGSWSQRAKLAPDDGAASFNFGWSVALSGANAVVSAPVAPVGNNALQGKAYVFAENAGTWTQTQALVASDGSASATFGSAVALDGNTAVIGANGVNAYFGAAYVFDGSSGSWLQTGELVPDDGVATEFFGLAVAVSGTTALVGAYNQRVGSNSGQGSAYIYTESGGSWTQQQKLTASDGAASARFGLSVALDGETALIGSYFAAIDGHVRQGAAYLFSRSGTTWTQSGKLVASDGVAEDHFGNAVALSGPAALVGAFDVAIDGNESQGAAYFYTQAADDTIFANGFDGAP
ncbi:MAG TPA: FG-GAP repeat protein, partial [Dokdonella sp.]